VSFGPAFFLYKWDLPPLWYDVVSVLQVRHILTLTEHIINHVINASVAVDT